MPYKPFKGFISILITTVYLFIRSGEINTITAGSQCDQLPYQESESLGRGTAKSIVWHPTENALAVGGSQGVWIYDERFNPLRHIEGENANMSHLAWSHDGQKLAGSTLAGQVYIWQSETGELVFELGEAIPEILRTVPVVWSKDDKIIATVTQNSGIEITLWGAENAEQLMSVEVDAWPTEIDISPDGQYIAGVVKGSLKLWELSTGKAIDELELGEIYATSLSWNPEGNMLAVAGTTTQGASLFIFEARSLELIHTIHSNSRTTSIEWNYDGTYIVGITGNSFGEAGITVWDITSQREGIYIGNNLYMPNAISLSRSNNHLAIAHEDNRLEVLNITTSEQIATSDKHSRPIKQIDWQPKGHLLAALEQEIDTYNIIKIWDAETGEVVQKIVPYLAMTSNEGYISWNPDGNKLIYLYIDSISPSTIVVKVWNIDNLQNNTPITFELSNTVPNVWWTPDGNLSTFDIGNKDFINLNLNTGQTENIQHISDQMAVIGLAVHPNKDKFGAIGSDNMVQIWSTNGRFLTSFQPIQDYRLELPIRWDTEGRWLAGSSQLVDTTKVWVWDSYEETVSTLDIELLGHLDLAWRPKSSLLTIGELQGDQIYIYDAVSGKQCVKIDRFMQLASSISWSSDGNRLSVGAGNGIDGGWIRVFTFPN